MKKFFIVIFFILFVSFAYTASEQKCRRYSLDYNEYNRVFPNEFLSKYNESFFVTGISKSGTNLLEKCLYLMTNRSPWALTPFYELLPSSFTEKERQKLVDHLYNEKNRFLIGRFPFISSIYSYTIFSNILFFINNYKTIFIIRDPRDRIISDLCHHPSQGVHYFSEHPDLKILKARIIGRCPMEEKLLCEYFYHPNILKIRFEDLVGKKSGGSLEKQRQSILDIANFINIQLSDEQVHYLCENLYGNSATFRKGTIGQWKQYFDDELKEIYKKECGQLLIDLGYEKDFNW